jgi:hypothetical protein
MDSKFFYNNIVQNQKQLILNQVKEGIANRNNNQIRKCSYEINKLILRQIYKKEKKT